MVHALTAVLWPIRSIDSSYNGFIEKLYRQTGKAALHKTAQLVGSQQIAEELVQEVFSRLWTSKISFSNEKSAFLWIYKSCHRAGIDYLRSGKKRYETHSIEGLNLVNETVSNVAHNRHLLAQCLRHLKDKEADLLAYLHIDSLSHDEAAELLGISRKTIGRMCRRIAKQMAKLKEDVR